jgi:HSP20 family protein
MKNRNFLIVLVAFFAVFLAVTSLDAEIKDVLKEPEEKETQKKGLNSWLMPFRSLAMPADPFFDSFEKEMDEMFKSFRGLRDMQMPDLTRNMHGYSQGRADMRVDEDNVIVLIDLPGHEREGIDLRIKNNNLIISSERKSELTEEEKDKYFRREISYGNFSRVISLPRKIIRTKAKASFKDGVLKVTIPIDKSSDEDEKGFKIKIE